MNTQQLFMSFTQKLELLTQILNESPYISREERMCIVKEIHHLSEKIHEGEVTVPQVENKLIDLNKRAAVDEILNLSNKIRHLNPSSPRLENLRLLSKELHEGGVSPDQARQKLQDLMS